MYISKGKKTKKKEQSTYPIYNVIFAAARSLQVNYHDIDPVHLPVESEVVTLVRHFLEGNKSWQLQETSKNPSCDHHGHPMILNEYMTEQDGSPNVKRNMEQYSSLCNGCIQPISPPFYSCIDMKCDFLLHKSCYEVPFQVHAREDLLLGGQDLENVLGIFHCDVCCRPCNGLKYFRRSNGNRVLDVKCALAPKYIIHESHPEHRLKLSKRKYGPCPACLLTGENQGGYIYRCLTCSFNLHQKCALYPSTVRHKYDKHPLKLTYKPIKGHLSDEYYCEICELELNLHGWFYHCIECEQYFHITCIPAVDHLSNIKFGATLKLDNHAHPLTFTRIILERPCGYCKESIKDGMAFQCMECKKYHIHFQCAKTCAPAQGDQPFPTGLVDGVNGHVVLTLTQTQDKSGAITGSWADHGDPPDVPIPVVNLPPEGGRDDISGSLSGSWDRGRILSVPKDLVDEQIALTLGRPRTRSGSKYSTSLDGGNLQIPTEPLKIGGDVALKPGGDKRGSISGRGAIRYFPEKRDVRAAGRDRLGGFEAYPMSEYVPPYIPMKREVLTHDQLELYDLFDASSYRDRRNKYIPTIGFRGSSTGRSRPSSAHSEIKTFVDMNRSGAED